MSDKRSVTSARINDEDFEKRGLFAPKHLDTDLARQAVKDEYSFSS